LREFNEWSVCTLIETVERYTPTEDETYDIMNILEEKLKAPNRFVVRILSRCICSLGYSAVVFATTKLFLRFTAALPHIHEAVYERIKTPVLTLLGSQSPELTYSVLHHGLLLIRYGRKRRRSLFACVTARIHSIRFVSDPILM
jgi:AP-4 complex subunit beta-1